jgi:hypothetical protein
MALIVIVRQISTFIFSEISTEDVDLYRMAGQLILDGKNPYTEQLVMANHPPGIFIAYALIMTFFGSSYTALKIPIYLFTISSAFIVFLICKQTIQISEDSPNELKNFQHPENKFYLPYFSMFLFLLNPYVDMRESNAQDDALAVFFFLLGFYFFLRSQDIRSGISFGISLLIKLVPLFMAPFLFIYLYRSKQIKRLIKIFGAAIFVSLFTLLPFLIDDFNNTILGLLQLANNRSYNQNYTVLFEEYYITKITLGNFTVSLWFCIQVVLFLLLLLVIFRLPLKLSSLMTGMSMIYFSLPALTNNFGPRYLMWIAGIYTVYLLVQKLYGFLIIFSNLPFIMIMIRSAYLDQLLAGPVVLYVFFVACYICICMTLILALYIMEQKNWKKTVVPFSTY